MDTLTPEQRSYTMSRIRSKDTKPEMLVRRHLHALGFRYRLHSSKLPGHPAIVDGDVPDGFTLKRLRKCIPDDWDNQRRGFGFL